MIWKTLKISSIHTLFLLMLFQTAMSQEDSLNKKRLGTVVTGASGLYLTSMFGLYHLWYKDYPQSNFHFFNDNDEWLQMDKAGHVTTAYYVSLAGYESLRWCGLDTKRSAWLGSGGSFLFLTTIEVFDGFSEQWGASAGDFMANTGGIVLFMTQQHFWGEQRILAKFSFHQTVFAKYRSDLLGKTFAENVLKDYNGQTYWLSANIKSFFRESRSIPPWLNLAVGYSAEGMTGSTPGSSASDGSKPQDFKRYRQYFLSPDIDISRIRTTSKLLALMLKGAGFIKIPLPALEYNENKGFKFHILYF